MFIVRIVMYGLLVHVVAVLTPGMYFTDWRILEWFWVAILFGVITSIVRPILQFFTLPFIFATYGLVVVVVNFIILLLFNYFTGTAFLIDSWLSAILGALLLTILGSFMESALGLTAPIIPDTEEELKSRVKFQERGMAYAIFEASPSELRKYAPSAIQFAEPLPSQPDTADAEAILATLDAAEGKSAVAEVGSSPAPSTESMPTDDGETAVVVAAEPADQEATS
jgi:putative membrane protein